MGGSGRMKNESEAFGLALLVHWMVCLSNRTN